VLVSALLLGVAAIGALAVVALGVLVCVHPARAAATTMVVMTAAPMLRRRIVLPRTSVYSYRQ
jgi:hypothetical protein